MQSELERLRKKFESEVQDRVALEVEKLKKNGADQEKLAAIKAVAGNAWKGYREFAFPHDEIKPISAKVSDPFNGWGATLVDSLDTLWVMGMEDEFEDAIQAVYNIDFTTVDRTRFNTLEDEDVEGEEGADVDSVPDIPSSDVSQGVLPNLIAKLVERRRQVKSLMKDKSATPSQLMQWNIKQLALKLTANSMYGCLGFENSRFYARPLAALTTFKGREILTATKDLAESMLLDVVYGDTDSVMINTNATEYREAIRIGLEFKKSVNERYRLLEIDIDWLSSTPAEYERLAHSVQEDLVQPTDNLSDLMYKSVGIRDSRQSLQLGLSMWRLSWITFIFLPLTFRSQKPGRWLRSNGRIRTSILSKDNRPPSEYVVRTAPCHS